MFSSTPTRSGPSLSMAYQILFGSAASSSCTLQSPNSSNPDSPLNPSVSSLDFECEQRNACQALIRQIESSYQSLAARMDLKPSTEVNNIFTDLVTSCLESSNEALATSTLADPRLVQITPHLRQLCSTGESKLERFWSTKMLEDSRASPSLQNFPYYSNYEAITNIEAFLIQNALPVNLNSPGRIAFIGSGSLPLTTILLAQTHFTSTTFINVDSDSHALDESQALVRRLALEDRIRALHADARHLDVSTLESCDVVYLAALVGMSPTEKHKLVESIAPKLQPGTLLVVRSAHGLRTLLYPVLDIEGLNLSRLKLEMVTEWVPKTSEVVNSVLIFRRL